MYSAPVSVTMNAIIKIQVIDWVIEQQVFEQKVKGVSLFGRGVEGSGRGRGLREGSWGCLKGVT